MKAETAGKLRAPFPAEMVGKLPRVWCRACRDVARDHRACGQHQYTKCTGCDQKITSAHVHLDFVGHADVTDRLLAVDPEWTWEPLAFDADGLPKFDQHGGLWIRLTIAGVTRIGYGSPDGKVGPDAIKETIGDSVRNGAMRYGVALDCWRKDTAPPAETAPLPQVPASNVQPAPSPTELRREIANAGQERGLSLDAVADDYAVWSRGGNIREAWAGSLSEYLDHLRLGREAALWTPSTGSVRSAVSTSARRTSTKRSPQPQRWRRPITGPAAPGKSWRSRQWRSRSGSPKLRRKPVLTLTRSSLTCTCGG